MIVAIPAVVVGLYLLTRSADVFVGGASRLSTALRVPAVVIGALVVGFGTSAPEMVVSAVASGQGKLDISAGNIVGSNIANLTLILGVSALLCRLTVDSKILRREAPLAVGGTLLYGYFLQDGLERWEGGVLAVAMIAAVLTIVAGGRDGSDELAAEVEEFVDGHRLSVAREVVRTLAGLVGVVVAAQLTVYGATEIADELGLGEGFVGLTLVALGTSLPELVTSIAAARQGEHDLIVGNLLGSNLFNALAVGSVSALVGPGQLDDPTLAGAATVTMFVVAFVTWFFMGSGRLVARWEALVLLATYAVTVPLAA